MNSTLDFNILKFEKLAVFSPGFSMRFTALCRATFVQCTEIVSTRYYCLQGTTYAYDTEKTFFFSIFYLFSNSYEARICFGYQSGMSRL